MKTWLPLVLGPLLAMTSNLKRRKEGGVRRSAQVERAKRDVELTLHDPPAL